MIKAQNYKLVLDQQALNYALLAIHQEFPYVRGWIDHLTRHKGLPGFVRVWKQLKAWALKLIAGENQYQIEWFRTLSYLGYKIPQKYSKLFQVLVRVIIDPKRYPRNLIRKILSILNLHHCVSGPCNLDVKTQVKTALAQRIIPENHGFWSRIVKLACKVNFIHVDSKIGVLSPTGQTVAISPGVNGSWGKFVATEIVDRYGGADHVINLDKLHRRIEKDFMGNLTPIGDTGGKTRLVLIANPFIQSQLVPLKRALLDILNSIPTDCTFRQDDGPRFIREKQKAGVILFSVDLKDATWNFPSSLQEEVLIAIGCRKELRDFLFRSKVYNPLDGKLHLVEKGQAMGLGPSFPLFSLTHNLVLFSLCKTVGVIPVETYRVLGDDVIIADRRVYKLYRQFLHEYGVPVSETKSLTSSKVAEFAGRIILDGVDITPIKWKKLTWNSISSLYWEYRHTFPWICMNHRKMELKDRIALYVLGPIPKSVGGLNLAEKVLPTSTGIISLRKGLLESMWERRNYGDSSGVVKIHNEKFEGDDLTPLWDTTQRRFLDSLLNTNEHLTTSWGPFPGLHRNPFGFLSQVGLNLRGLPLRTKFDPEQGFKFRFKSTRSKAGTWKDVLFKLLDSVKECNHDQSGEKSHDGTAVCDYKEKVQHNFTS